jgi:signal transduction histidine kinase
MNDRELDEVRRSRRRVVAAADAERRRLERALHDGVQQQLVAVAVNLQLARELVASDRCAATLLLDEIRSDVHEALEAVRVLSHSIYPALLLDRGLGDALRGAAAEVAYPTRVETAIPKRLSPDVEAAVYFCCQAALAAVEQARTGTRAVVRVTAEGEALVFEVVVDGDARGEADRASVPVELADRVGAVGGGVSVTTESGGTRITGTIPLAQP